MEKIIHINKGYFFAEFELVGFDLSIGDFGFEVVEDFLLVDLENSVRQRFVQRVEIFLNTVFRYKNGRNYFYVFFRVVFESDCGVGFGLLRFFVNNYVKIPHIYFFDLVPAQKIIFGAVVFVYRFPIIYGIFFRLLIFGAGYGCQQKKC